MAKIYSSTSAALCRSAHYLDVQALLLTLFDDGDDILCAAGFINAPKKLIDEYIKIGSIIVQGDPDCTPNSSHWRLESTADCG
jgi:hypothetical protein